MKKIIRKSLIMLQNLEMFQLIVDILKYLTKKDAKTLLFEEALADLSAKQTTYDQALIKENELKNPAEMNNADADRDNGIRSLNNGITFFADDYPIDAKQKAAERLVAILKRHGGSKIAYMAQATESGALTNLFQELELEANKSDIALLGFTDLVAFTTQANNVFISQKQERDQKNSLLIMGQTKEARTQVETAFATLCERINALTIINGEAGYAEIIDTINHSVELHIATAKLRLENARKNKKKKETQTPATPDTAPKATDEATNTGETNTPTVEE